MISVDINGINGFIDEGEVRRIDSQAAYDKIAALNESGWIGLPGEYDAALSAQIRDMAARICGQSAALVVIGIGGSYLGARAAIEYIISPNYNALPKGTPDIYFAGNNASGEYLQQVIALIGDRDYSVNVVSKSGSTIETSIALRFFKAMLLDRYGADGLKERLYVTTDSSGSPLREMAAREGYACLEMPPRVGGRYSVLTVVGLLPCAVAGIDIDAVMAGALEEMESGVDNARLYAATRQALYRNGKKIEMLACFEPAFRYTGEWWKQLFGESEGKEGIGIFPAFADYTADLHSLGQYIQEGERTLFETFVSFGEPRADMAIPGGSLHDDKISALAGMGMHEVNKSASEAVKKAHIDGGVPIIELSVPRLSAASFGALVYFFERSCAISALVSGVNPFGQPGVEAYKKNLYAILGLV
ncbi:MAG: glucose-6-phosphate isomerase [Oscillospiraceae bacterium]|nr:glucose-6-phosphate isomerase [Oscillospiraceae bacterium]